MPDVNGFNLLGTEVACIEDGCDARGPVWEWPVSVRARHAKAHTRDRARDAARRKRDAARRARQLARQVARENDIAYGGGGA